MNQIERVRRRIDEFFKPELIQPDEHDSDQSPSGNFQLEVDVYSVDDPGSYWCIAIATVTDRRTGEVVAQVKRNDERFWHAWIERDQIEYLVCSEDLEGQTVVDLTHRRVEGYRSGSDDLFIWTEFHPSPSRYKLAVIGCYWACPYAVVTYDFREPMALPLKQLAETPLPDSRAQFKEWLDDETIALALADGTTQVHKISE